MSHHGSCGGFEEWADSIISADSDFQSTESPRPFGNHLVNGIPYTFSDRFIPDLCGLFTCIFYIYE